MVLVAGGAEQAGRGDFLEAQPAVLYGQCGGQSRGWRRGGRRRGGRQAKVCTLYVGVWNREERYFFHPRTCFHAQLNYLELYIVG